MSFLHYCKESQISLSLQIECLLKEFLATENVKISHLNKRCIKYKTIVVCIRCLAKIFIHRCILYHIPTTAFDCTEESLVHLCSVSLSQYFVGSDFAAISATRLLGCLKMFRFCPFFAKQLTEKQ